jgi:hypothetical protein
VAKIVDRIMGATNDDEDALGGRPAERVATYVTGRGSGESAGASAKAAEGDDQAILEDYTKIGEHVASVLESARTAAAKIREDARADARRVAERARAEAADLVGGAQAEAARIKAEAERLGADAERASRDTRNEAEAFATERRQSAEAEASKIVARAETEAHEHTREAQERRRDLDKNIARAEERLTQLVGGLREVAGRLESLVTGNDDEGATSASRDDERLDESLHKSASEQATRESTT